MRTRTLADIDCELTAALTARQATRTRIGELDAALLGAACAHEAHTRRIDRLLEERAATLTHTTERTR